MPPASGPPMAITELKYARSAVTVAVHAFGCGATVSTSGRAPAEGNVDTGGAASESWPQVSQKRPSSAAPQAGQVPVGGATSSTSGRSPAAEVETAAGRGDMARPQTSQNSSSAELWPLGQVGIGPQLSAG